MSAIDKISSDLKLADFKLLDLRKSFEHLKSQSSPVSSITLPWHHIETHFNSLRSSLLLRLHSIQPRQQQHDENPNNNNNNNVRTDSEETTQSCDPTPIQSLCLNMDAKGLRSHLNDREGQHESMREELSAALETSPNAAKLVLDAVKGFYTRDTGVVKLSVVRKSCVLLLEELMGLSFEIEIDCEVKEEATELANEWKERLVVDESEGSVVVYGFLLFLCVFRLRKGFEKSELLGLFECVCSRMNGPELVPVLGLVKKMPKLIRNLIDKKLHLEAIRYIYAFELVDKFSPVPILKDHLEHSKKIAKKIRKGNSGSENKATTKEITALRAVIQCITDHNLESVFSPKSLEKRIVKLEKKVRGKHILAAAGAEDQLQEICRKKRKKCTSQIPTITPSPVLSHTSAPAPSPTFGPTSAPDPRAQPQENSGNKYFHINESAAPFAHTGVASTIPSTQPHCWQPAGFYPNNTAINFSTPPSVTQHMSLSAGPYRFLGSHAIPLHTVSTAGNYLLGFAPNVNAEQYQFPGTYAGIAHGSGFNPSVPYYHRNAVPEPGYYVRPPSGSVYGPPSQYHPPYHH